MLKFKLRTLGHEDSLTDVIKTDKSVTFNSDIPVSWISKENDYIIITTDCHCKYNKDMNHIVKV